MKLPDSIIELIDFDEASKRVTTREGKHREFKETFEKVSFSSYTKALAAFSNTDGGVLIFGVSDNPRSLVGTDMKNIPDEATWADRLSNDFDPEIVFETKEYEHDGLTVFAISVSRSERRPIICKRTAIKLVTDKKGKTKDVTVLQEGHIYYRYSGKTAPIKYVELSEILAERDARKLRAIMENLEIMERIGSDKVGIVDASKSELPGAATNLYVSKETAKAMNFVDRGKLVEEEGSPAYVVAGSVVVNEVVERLIPDEDKILPAVAAAKLLPVMKSTYSDNGFTFTAGHLAKLATGLGIRDEANPNEDYFLKDKSFKRTCYRGAALEIIEEKIGADPIGCLKLFASKETLAKHVPNEDEGTE